MKSLQVLFLAGLFLIVRADYYDWLSPEDCEDKHGKVDLKFYCWGTHYPDDVCCKLHENSTLAVGQVPEKNTGQMPIQTNQDVVNVLGAQLTAMTQKITDAINALGQKLEALVKPAKSATAEQKKPAQ